MPEMIEKSNIVGIVELHVYTEVGVINVFLPLRGSFPVYRCSIVYQPPCFNLAPAHLFQLSCCCEWDPPLT